MWKIAAEMQVEKKVKSASKNFKAGNVKDGIKDSLIAAGLFAARVASEFIRR